MRLVEREVKARFWADILYHRLHRAIGGERRQALHSSSPEIPSPVLHESQSTYLSYREAHRHEIESVRRWMSEQEQRGRSLRLEGDCYVCRRTVGFWVEAVRANRNTAPRLSWREGMLCPGCRFNGRQRASAALVDWAFHAVESPVVLFTEQVTSFYRWAKSRFPNAIGSEYLRDGTARGQRNAQGIRHEDLNALSFADASLDGIVSLEVLEHVPDCRRAMAECARVIKPGGRLVLSVPFHGGKDHLLRARLDAAGQVEHLEEPEYHGDPLDSKGCLCFHHFGWDLLDQLKQAGFRSAWACSTGSKSLGQFDDSGDMLMFLAEK